MNLPEFILEFKDPAGLQFKEFNTLRLGPSWGKRLKKGDRVILASKHRVIGQAKVTAIHVEERSGFFLRHCFMNHIEMALLGAPNHGSWDLGEAMRRREASMLTNYGARAFERATKMTAIYLKRLK